MSSPASFAFRPRAAAPAAPAAPAARHAVRRFVGAFYDQVRADALLGPVFARVIADTGWDAHLEAMTDFWLAVAWDGPPFRGNPLVKHAAIRDIAPAHFARWLAIFEPVARAAWPAPVADRVILRARQLAPALQAGVARAREKGLVDTYV